MKRLLLILAILFVPHLARAQQTLSAAGSDCTVTNACMSVAVSRNQGGATFAITANASSNTIQIEASADGGTTWVALNATPSNGTTAASSSTSTGIWQANVAGYTNVRLRMSTLVSGTTTVNINQSSASARAGGGGGGSTTGNVSMSTGTQAILASDPKYGLSPDAQWACAAVWGNASQSVATDVTLDPAFTVADVGSMMFGTTGPCQGGGGGTGGTVQIALGTITAFTDAHHVTVSTTSSGACNSGGAILCTFTWAKTDNLAALQSAFDDLTLTLAGKGCGTLILPVGKMWVSGPIYETAAVCGAIPGGDGRANQGYTVKGQGVNATYLVASPSFDGTHCNTGCFFGSNSGQAINISDMSVFGGGKNSITNIGTNAIFKVPFLGSLERLGVWNWGNNTSAIAFYVQGITQGSAYANDLQAFDGAGACFAIIDSVVAKNVFCYDAFSSIINPNGNYVDTYGMQVNTGSNAQAPVSVVGGGTWNSNGDVITTVNRNCISAGGTSTQRINLIGDILQNNVAGASFPCLNMSSSSVGVAVTLTGTSVKNIGGGDWIGGGASGATITDSCGNIATGTATLTTIAWNNCSTEPSIGGRCLLASAVSPLACKSAGNGKVAVPATTTTYTINTTAVQSGSFITLIPTTDNTGISGAPTCATVLTPFASVTATVAATSFTFSLPSNAGISCFAWSIR